MACAEEHEKLNEGPILWAKVHDDGMLDYVEDMNHAITLCDALAKEGWAWSASGGDSNKVQFWFWKPRKPEQVHTVTSSLPEAIVIAFLKVRNRWRE